MGIPYIYVKSRQQIGEACKTKRPTSCVFVATPEKKSDVKEKYKRCEELIKSKNPYIK